MKRIVWCVAVMMLLLCVDAWALAEEEIYSDGDYEYVLLEDGSAKIMSFIGPDETDEVEIPGELDGHTVTAMDIECFGERWELTSVTIPDSVTEIEGNSFYRCRNLQTIEVSPDHPTLAVIDGVLFDKTEKRLLCYPAGLEAAMYQIPQGITAIADGAFHFCEKLERVSIPDSVTAIGVYAFANSGLIDVSVPATVTSIGGGAFCYCTWLRSAVVPDGITAIGDWTFNLCRALEDVSLPDSLESIGERAFKDCDSLAQISLPDSLESIGNDAFHNCDSLAQISLPDSLESIGERAFADCDSLAQISLPDGLTEISFAAFGECDALEDVNLPDSLESIAGRAFWFCDSLAQISLPDGVTSIGWEAFRDCESLTEVTIPGSVSSIGKDAFDGCPEDLVLTVERDSYASDYARDNGIDYAYEDADDWLFE